MANITAEQQRQATYVHMAMIADHCVKTCIFEQTDPATLGLYVDQDAQMWHIRSAHRPDVVTFPAGTGTLAWNTEFFPDVETAFQHALEEAWREKSTP
jgi:hypothetical protein